MRRVVLLIVLLAANGLLGCGIMAILAPALGGTHPTRSGASRTT